MVEINIFLFSKPENEIELEEAKPEDFRKLGDELQVRLNKVAEIVEKLEKNKWERSAGLYDLSFYKKIKVDDAKKELEKLGIKEDEVDIMEEEFDEEIEEEFEEDNEE